MYAAERTLFVPPSKRVISVGAVSPVDPLGLANRYPVVNATFGTGNGSLVSFALLNGAGLPVAQAWPVSIYKTDWQGQQLLYPTPRTNYWANSANLATGWRVVGGVIGAASASPDGTATTFPLTEDTSTGGHQIYYNSAPTLGVNVPAYAQFTASLKAGTRAVGVFFNSASGSTNYGSGIAFDLVNATWVQYGAYGSGFVLDQISMYPVSAGIYLCRCRFTPPVGFNVDASYLQMVDGTSNIYTGDGTSAINLFAPMISDTPGSYIASGSTATTLTDYTMTGTTVTPDPVAATGATFQWTGIAAGNPA